VLLFCISAKGMHMMEIFIKKMRLKFSKTILVILILLLVFLFVGYVGAILIVDFLSTYIFDPYSSFMNVLITNLLSGVAEPWKTHLINLLSGDLGLLTAGPAWTIGLILPIVAIVAPQLS